MSTIAERCNCSCHEVGHCLVPCCENAKQPRYPVTAEHDIESKYALYRGQPFPDWFNFSRGSAMRVTFVDLEKRILTISSHKDDNPAAQVRISLADKTSICPWRIDWHLLHSSGESLGHVRCKTQTLKRAFGLDDSHGDLHNNWPNRFNATTAAGRVFVRKNLHLCIPGPGTASDGDPNVSIELTNRMAMELFCITRDF